jgi:hypothetical protein
MNPKETLPQAVAEIKRLLQEKAKSTFALAKKLYQVKRMYVWKHTSYGSWTNFCEKEVDLSPSYIWRLITSAGYVEKYSYTEEECTEILNAMSYPSFEFGLSSIKRRISIKSFIKIYRGQYANKGHAAASRDPNFVFYRFALPLELSKTFEAVLKNYGLVVLETGHRNHLQSSIQKFLENVLPE